MSTYANSPERRSLAWLADAPLFIDGPQVSALYDAVVKPEYATASIKLSHEKVKGIEAEGKAGAEVEIGFADWLKSIFPFIDAKAKVSAEASGTGKLENKQGSEIELHSIDTPQRQLVQLALHYLANIPHRVSMVADPAHPTETKWLERTFVSALPRGLVFVDFPPRTKFVPMAAELENGKIEPIYPQLVKQFSAPKDPGDPAIPAPEYPEPAYFIDRDAELADAREAYWNFFDKQFGSTIAMVAVESVSQTSLLRWIDYRVPLGVGLPCIHLHVQGNATYNTGAFAYQLVKRGYKHGLRIVGTMKSEPAMNVLAIFEK